MRTAATSVVAAEALARADSRVMAVIGNGAQSEFQALAFHPARHRGTAPVRRRCRATAKLVANLHGSGLRSQRLRQHRRGRARCRHRHHRHGRQDPRHHHHGTDAGTGPAHQRRRRRLPRQDRAARRRAARGAVFVEYEPQSRIEGDLQQMPADFAVTELWRVLAGERSGRRRRPQITVFDSVGFALEDFSALRYLRDAAARLNSASRSTWCRSWPTRRTCSVRRRGSGRRCGWRPDGALRQ